ncbi:alpha/beta fold hydrolase [Mesorhizobium sp. B2-4-15]|uniref:epoxide hydrolase family protein n=1 Tax=Mesorhizobium sp. B2-4-15 TaxID=2589934 RepID=UPI00115238CE|nr:epoxide hydrolase family protein [Mesorhizobium sp. B2-4-15]TPK66937.1 alpha/beta fold hydrolase [Mesorhizobium sp. B2-4-15]
MSPISLSPTRREVLAATAAAGVISLLPQALHAATDAEAIRPFTFSFPDEDLADLRQRVAATRWPKSETVTDASQGVQLSTIQKLARYWATDYDWKRCEAQLKALPHFVTEIDGLDIHFIHVRSKHENALPLIVTHGWPGSIIEQLKIIDPLTNPTAHGASASDAFDIVVPSLPGYGFSGKPTVTGWDTPRIARAWVTLMKRLGYTNFVAAGGDVGAQVGDELGVQAPSGLLGVHSNMPGTLPADISKALNLHEPAPAGLSADEQNAWNQLELFYKKGLGYANEMSLRPQTLYALEDSPVGLAAWILDHDAGSYAMIARSIDRQPEGLTPDDVLDNITFYWLTKTAVSSARLYWDASATAKKGFFDVKGVNTIPFAVSAFPDEIYTAPKSWAEKAYPKLIHYNKLPKGTHFAAWEQPKFYSEEVRASFRQLRSA